MTEIKRSDLIGAELLDRRYSITQRLGISENPDRELALLYLQQRLFKGGIYQSTWFLSRPQVFQYLERPYLRWIVSAYDRSDRSDRQSLAELEEATSQFVEAHYQTPEQRYKARSLELAINDLYARATNSQPSIRKPSFKPNEEMLGSWAERWSPSLAADFIPIP